MKLPFSGDEPKSVLDLRGTPSPAPTLHPLTDSQYSDDWGSFMTDFNSQIALPDFVQSDLNGSVGIDYVDDLICLADCFETNSLHLILNQRFTSPAGQRAAFYFKEALHSLLTHSTQPATSSQIIETIKAQNIFSTISPIPLFSSFTANQAILEAVHGSMHLHVIDFDVGLGAHWASFMKALSGKAASPLLRISAVVPDEYAAESRLIGENLTQFARDLNIRFDIEFISIRTFEYLSFKSINLIDGAKVAVLLSSAIFGRIGDSFLNDLRRVSPHVVVHVDVEGGSGCATTSFRQAVVEGLEFYSALLESLESGGGGDGMEKIERLVVYPKIVEAARRRGRGWREGMVAAGMREVWLSESTELQAEFLVGRAGVRGFHVVRREGEMMLCWHDTPLVATSSWKF